MSVLDWIICIVLSWLALCCLVVTYWAWMHR